MTRTNARAQRQTKLKVDKSTKAARRSQRRATADLLPALQQYQQKRPSHLSQKTQTIHKPYTNAHFHTYICAYKHTFITHTHGQLNLFALEPHKAAKVVDIAYFTMKSIRQITVMQYLLVTFMYATPLRVLFWRFLSLRELS